MAAKRKPAAKNWQEREIADWNVTTFHAYLIDQHEERYRVPYYPFGTWIVEKKMIKSQIDEHGASIVKQFIDKCFQGYMPSDRYPGISFGFMFKYQNRFLQQLLKTAGDRKRQEAMDALFAGDEKKDDGGDDLDWI